MTHSALATGTSWTADRSSRDGAKIDRFIVHHAATTSLSAILALFQPGGRTVSANYALKDHRLIATVPEEYRAWTSASYADDRRAVTIEVANSQAGGSWPVSDASFDKLARLIADVSARYRFDITDDTILTHQELYRRFGRSYATACPGDLQRRKGELINLARKYRGQGVAAPAASSSEATWGGIKVKDIQTRLNVHGAKLVVDGIYGPLTASAVRAFQGAHGLTVDGDVGPVTWAALQQSPASATPAKLEVDGIWGVLTTKALQRDLGVTPDGIIGPVTAKALQKRLGVTPDGIIGPVTRKALQARLGVTQDGIWGRETTKALQRRLNAGRL